MAKKYSLDKFTIEDNAELSSSVPENNEVNQVSLNIRRSSRNKAPVEEVGQFFTDGSIFDDGISFQDATSPTGIAKHRHEEQPWYASLGAAANQAIVGEIAGGTLEGLGYLLDIPQYANLASGTEKEFGNWFSDLGKSMRTWSQEATPIYADPSKQGEFSPEDWSWWMSNAPSVASTLSLMIPSGLAVKGLSSLGKMTKLSKGLGLINEAGQISKTGLAVKGISQAVISRHMENIMEASGTAEELRGLAGQQITSDQAQKIRDNYGVNLQPSGWDDSGQAIFKIDENTANEIAAKAAANSYKANWAMLAQDIPQYIMLNAPFGKVTEKLTAGLGEKLGQSGAKIALNDISNHALNAIGEGGEEAYQYAVGERAKELALADAGLVDERDLSSSLKDYATRGDLWTSAFFGAIGAGAMQVAGKPFNKAMGRIRGIESEEERRVKDIDSWSGNVNFHNNLISMAEQSGREDLADVARESLTVNTAINAAKNGNLGHLVETLQQMESATDQDAEIAGITPEMVQQAKKNNPTLIKDIKRIGELYQSNLDKYGQKFAPIITNQEFKIESSSSKLGAVNSKINNAISSIPNFSKLSTTGQELFKLDNEIQANKVLLNTLKERHNSQESTKDQDLIKFSQDRINSITEIIQGLEEQKSSLEYSKEDKAADKKVNITSPILEEYNKLNTDKVFLEEELTSAQEYVEQAKKPSWQAAQIKKAEAIENSKIKDAVDNADSTEGLTNIRAAASGTSKADLVEKEVSKKASEQAKDVVNQEPELSTPNIGIQQEPELSKPNIETGINQEPEFTKPNIKVEGVNQEAEQAAPSYEAKKADIERRRQEELGKFKKRYDDDISEINSNNKEYPKTIPTNAKGEPMFGGTSIYENAIKAAKDNLEYAKSQINAKYDAELAALEEGVNQEPEQITSSTGRRYDKNIHLFDKELSGLKNRLKGLDVGNELLSILNDLETDVSTPESLYSWFRNVNSLSKNDKDVMVIANEIDEFYKTVNDKAKQLLINDETKRSIGVPKSEITPTDNSEDVKDLSVAKSRPTVKRAQFNRGGKAVSRLYINPNSEVSNVELVNLPNYVPNLDVNGLNSLEYKVGDEISFEIDKSNEYSAINKPIVGKDYHPSYLKSFGDKYAKEINLMTDIGGYKSSKVISYSIDKNNRSYKIKLEVTGGKKTVVIDGETGDVSVGLGIRTVIYKDDNRNVVGTLPVVSSQKNDIAKLHLQMLREELFNDLMSKYDNSGSIVTSDIKTKVSGVAGDISRAEVMQSPKDVLIDSHQNELSDIGGFAIGYTKTENGKKITRFPKTDIADMETHVDNNGQIIIATKNPVIDEPFILRAFVKKLSDFKKSDKEFYDNTLNKAIDTLLDLNEDGSNIIEITDKFNDILYSDFTYNKESKMVYFDKNHKISYDDLINKRFDNVVFNDKAITKEGYKPTVESLLDGLHFSIDKEFMNSERYGRNFVPYNSEVNKLLELNIKPQQYFDRVSLLIDLNYDKPDTKNIESTTKEIVSDVKKDIQPEVSNTDNIEDSKNPNATPLVSDENVPNKKRSRKLFDTGLGDTSKGLLDDLNEAKNKPKARTASESVPVWNKAEELDWFKANFPSIPVGNISEIMPQIKEVLKNGEEAWGAFKDASVYFHDNAGVGTAYHEAFHVIFNLYLTTEQQTKVLKDAVGKTTLDKEEWLADQFMDKLSGVNKKKSWTKPILDFFRKLYYTVKSMITNDISSINEIARRADIGMYRNASVKLGKFSSNNLKLRIADWTYRKEKNAVDAINKHLLMSIVPAIRDSNSTFANMTDTEVMNTIVRSKGVEFLYQQVSNDLLTVAENATEEQQNKLYELVDYLFDENGNAGKLFGASVRGLANNNGIKVSMKAVKNSEINLEDQYDFQDSEESYKESWMTHFTEISAKNNAPYRIKSYIRYIKTGSVNEFGLPEYVNYDDTYNSLLSLLSNSINVAQMIGKLKDSLSFNPEYKQIIDKLDSDPVFESEFFFTFAKTHTKFSMVFEKDGKYILTDANRKGITKEIITRWTNSVLSSSNVLSVDDNFNYTVDTNLAGQIKDIMDSIANKKVLEDSDLENLSKITKYLGFEIPVSVFKYVNDNKIGHKFITGQHSLQTIVNKFAEGKNPFDSEAGLDVSESASINQLAKITKKAMPSLFESSFKNIDGKSQYSHLIPNYLSNLVNRLHSKDTSKATIDGFQRDNMFKSNVILNELYSLRSDEDGLSDIFDFSVVDGLNDPNGRIGYADMKQSDLQTMSLAAYYNNGNKSRSFYRGPVLSDASNMVLFKFKRYSSEEAIDHLLNLAESEYIRIQELKAFESLGINNFNSESNLTTENGYHIMPMFNGFKGSPIENEAAAKKLITDWFAERTSEYKELLRKNDVLIYEGENLDYKKSRIDERLSDRDIDSFLGEFYLNDFLMRANFSLITVGDPAFYKPEKGTNNVVVDYTKRAKEIYSPKYIPNVGATFIPKDGSKPITVSETYNSIYLADNNIEGPSYSSIASAIDEAVKSGHISESKARVIKASYNGKSRKDNDGIDGEVNQTDAQAYISLSFYRETMVSLGRWTDKHQEAYPRLLEGKGTANDIALVMQPLKPFMYTQIWNPAINKMVPVQHKNSEFLLLPQLANNHPKLKTILDLMNSKNVGVVNFESAIKTGLYGATDLENIDNAVVHNIPMEDRGIQMETPEHFQDSSNLFGTQIRKLIMADLIEGVDYDVKGWKSVKAKELYDMYERIIMEDLAEAYSDAYDTFTTDGQVDYRKVSQILMDKSKGEEFEKAIEYDEANNRIRLPLFHPLYASSVENMITSIFKNRVTKQKISGGAFVQASGFGLSKELKLVFGENNALQHAEILLPAWSKQFYQDFIDEDGNIDFEQVEKSAPELLEMIGYRIPTEDKYSMLPLKVVGFLPLEAGGAVMLPAEITTISGSDFDVDKMYIMMKSGRRKTADYYQISKDYKDSIKKDYGITEFTKDEITNNLSKIILGDKPNLDFEKLIDEYNGNIKDIASKNLNKAVNTILSLQNEIVKDFEKENSKRVSLKFMQPENVQTVLELYNNSKESYDNMNIQDKAIVDFYLQNKEAYGELVRYEADKMDYEDGATNSKEARNNAKIDLMTSVLRNQATLGSLFNPGGFDNLQEIAKEINKLRGKGKESMPLFDTATADEMAVRNMAGKQLVGVAANHTSHHAVRQHFNLEFRNDIMFDGKSLNKLGNTADISGEDYISRNYSEISAAVVDNAKDPIAAFINYNTFTADVISSIIGVGYKPETAFFFASQPIILELIDRMSKDSNKSEQVIMSELADSIKVNLDAELSNIDTSSMKKEIGSNNLDSNLQKKVLVAFYNYYKLGRGLNKLIRSSRADTKGLNGTMANGEMTLSLIDDVSSIDFVIAGADEMFNGSSMIQSFTDNGIRKPMSEVIENVLPYNNPLYKEIKDSINDNLNGRDLSEDMRNSINRQIMSFYLSGFEYFDIGERANIVKGLPAEFFKYLEEHPEMKNNDLFKRLSYEVKTDKIPVDRLVFNNSGSLTDEQRVTIQRAFEDLLDSKISEPHAVEVAHKLLKYAYFSSGMNFTASSFAHLIPVDAYLNKMRDGNGNIMVDYLYRLQEFNENIGDISNSFLDQYYRNNYSNKSIVPRVNDNKSNISSMSNDGNFIYVNDNVKDKSFLIKSGQYYTPVSFIAQDLDKSTNLYKFIGTDQNGTHTYQKTNKLGVPNYVVEYNVNMNNMESIIADNNLTNLSKPQNSSGEINVYWGASESKDNTRILSNLAPRKFKHLDFDAVERDYESVEHAYQTLKNGFVDMSAYDRPQDFVGTKKRAPRLTDKGKRGNLELMKDLVVESLIQNPNSEAVKKLLQYNDFTHKQGRTPMSDQAFLDGLYSAKAVLESRSSSYSKENIIKPTDDATIGSDISETLEQFTKPNIPTSKEAEELAKKCKGK